MTTTTAATTATTATTTATTAGKPALPDALRAATAQLVSERTDRLQSA